MEKRPPRFDGRLIAALLAAPVAVIAVVGLRGLMSGSPRPTPSPSPGIPAPTQVSIVHTPLPVTVAPTPAATLPPPIPPAREMTAMAYDDVHHNVVMFGAAAYGPDVSQTPANDTWTLDASGWHQRHPRTNPPPLGAALMTADPASHDLLLVGVSDVTASVSSETIQTWMWDGVDWRRRADLPGHEPLDGLATLAAAREVVLTTAAVPEGGGPATATHTWRWNGSSWSLTHPPGSLPLGGSVALLVSDPAHARVLALVEVPPDSEPQTWSWDGATWTQLAAPNQPPYDPITASAAEDPVSGDIVLYMGGGDSRNGGTTWVFDGTRWQLAEAPSPTIDTDYHGTQLLADTQIRAVIVIGGAGRPNPLNALWIFIRGHWTAVPPGALGCVPTPCSTG